MRSIRDVAAGEGVHRRIRVEAIEVASRANKGRSEESVEARTRAEIKDMFALAGEGLA